VEMFTERLRQLLDRGLVDEAVELLRGLYNVRATWLVHEAYRRQTGDELRHVLWPDGDTTIGSDLFALADSVHWDDAVDMYWRLAAATFYHPKYGTVPITPRHRAHEYVMNLEQWGVKPSKVYAMSPPGSARLLGVLSPYAFGATPGAPRQAKWGAHVAPTIRVDPGDGSEPKDWVLDPVLGLGRPVTVPEWLDAIGVPEEYAFEDLRGIRPAADPLSADAFGPERDADQPQVWITHPSALIDVDYSYILRTSLLGSRDGYFRLRGGDDELREHNREADRRAKFRRWHERLTAVQRALFDPLYSRLDPDTLREFHTWFHQYPQDRDNFSRWFSAALRTDVLTLFAYRGVDQLNFTFVGRPTADAQAVQIVRIVPAGGLVLDEQDLAELRQKFKGTGRTVFVPSLGSRVEVRQVDLVVLGPGPGPGSWMRLANEMPDRGYATTGTGRLARDMTSLDIEPTEGELVTRVTVDSHPQAGVAGQSPSALAGEDVAGAPLAGAGELLAAGALGPEVVYAGAGDGGAQLLAGQVPGWLGQVLGLLRAVNPLRERGGEFATNCVLASIAVDMALAEGEGFQAGAAELREVADIERYAGRPLVAVDGFAAVASAVKAAGPGARGVVSFRAMGDAPDHMVNVVADGQGRVAFLDGQAGGLAALPKAPALVRLVLTAGPQRSPERTPTPRAGRHLGLAGTAGLAADAPAMDIGGHRVPAVDHGGVLRPTMEVGGQRVLAEVHRGADGDTLVPLLRVGTGELARASLVDGVLRPPEMEPGEVLALGVQVDTGELGNRQWTAAVDHGGVLRPTMEVGGQRVLAEVHRGADGDTLVPLLRVGTGELARASLVDGVLRPPEMEPGEVLALGVEVGNEWVPAVVHNGHLNPTLALADGQRMVALVRPDGTLIPAAHPMTGRPMPTGVNSRGRLVRRARSARGMTLAPTMRVVDNVNGQNVERLGAAVEHNGQLHEAAVYDTRLVPTVTVDDGGRVIAVVRSDRMLVPAAHPVTGEFIPTRVSQGRRVPAGGQRRGAGMTEVAPTTRVVDRVNNANVERWAPAVELGGRVLEAVVHGGQLVPTIMHDRGRFAAVVDPVTGDLVPAVEVGTGRLVRVRVEGDGRRVAVVGRSAEGGGALDEERAAGPLGLTTRDSGGVLVPAVVHDRRVLEAVVHGGQLVPTIMHDGERFAAVEHPVTRILIRALEASTGRPVRVQVDTDGRPVTVVRDAAGHDRSAAGPLSLSRVNGDGDLVRAVRVGDHLVDAEWTGRQLVPRYDNEHLPWYARREVGADGAEGRVAVHAMGDRRVEGASRMNNAGHHATQIVTDFVNQPGRRPTVSGKLRKKLASKIALALESTDRVTLADLLRKGFTVGDSGTVVKVSFTLEPHGQTDEARRPADPYYDLSMSEYSDAQAGGVSSRSRGLHPNVGGDDVWKVADTKFSDAGLAYKLSESMADTTSHDLITELQAGRRAIISGPRRFVDYNVRVSMEAFAKGHPVVPAYTTRVADKTVIASHAMSLERGQEDGGKAVKVANQAAVERFTPTLSAVDTAPLERSLLRKLTGSGALWAGSSAKVITKMIQDLVGEKAVQDRAQYLSEHLPSTAIQADYRLQDYRGYVRLTSRILSVQPIDHGDGGFAPSGVIRHDTAKTTTMAGGLGRIRSVELGLGTAVDLPWGGGLTVLGTAGRGSKGSADSSVQIQPKSAIVVNGGLKRFRVQMAFSGEIHADPNIKGFTASQQIVEFGRDPDDHVVLDGEILVPADRAEEFLAQIATGDKSLQGMLGGVEPDSGGVTGFPDHDSLSTHLWNAAAEDGDYTVVRVTNGYFSDLGRSRGFTPAGRRNLFALARQGRVRIVEAPDPAAGDGSPQHVLDIGGTADHPVLASTPIAAGNDPFTDGRRGYDLDAYGVRSAWVVSRPDDEAPRFASERNPGYARYPSLVRDGLEDSQRRQLAPYRTPAPTSVRVTDIAVHRRMPRALRGGEHIDAEPAPGRIALVTGRLGWRDGGIPHMEDVAHAEEHPNGAAADGVRGDPAAGHDEVQRYVYGNKLLRMPEDGRYDVPATGYVASATGRVASGWRPARGSDGITGGGQWHEEDFGSDASAGSGTRDLVVDLLRKTAGDDSGVQLVMDPDGTFAAALRAATQRHLDGSTDSRAGFLHRAQQRLREDILDELSLNDALEMLVTSPKVRIVDEDGVVQGRAVDRDGNVTGEGLHAYPVSPAVRLHEEYLIRPDGAVSKSVTWRPEDLDGRTQHHEIPFLRRPRLATDPQRETAELAARVGLGTASFLEMPGADRVQADVRDQIVAMVNSHRRWYNKLGIPRSANRFGNLAAFERWGLDKKLQTAFSGPALRGSRGEALENGVHAEVTLGGRKYEMNVTMLIAAREDVVGVRAGTQLDLQTKGSRSAAVSKGRTYTAGIEAEFEYSTKKLHFGEKKPNSGERGGSIAVTVPDLTLSVDHEWERESSVTAIGKQQTRLQAPQQHESYRPEYAIRYEWEIKEIRPSSLFKSARVKLGDGTAPIVRASGVVHSDYRPAAGRVQEQGFGSAFSHIVSTVGRTTELSHDEFQLIEQGRHEQLHAMNFDDTGTIGLAGFFSGLKDAADKVQDAVNGVGGERVADIDVMFTDGFFRTNLHRLLSRQGMAIVLPVKRGGRSGFARSVRVRAILVDADDGADFEAQGASIEHYTESDMRSNYTKSGTLSGQGTATAAINVRWGGSDTTGGQANAANSRRSNQNDFTLSAGVGGHRNFWNRTKSDSDGSLDLSLVKEPAGMQVKRKHLVLQVITEEHPVDRYGTGVQLVDTGVLAPRTPEPRRLNLLVENGVELMMSNAFHKDFAALPQPENARKVTQTETALSTGFCTYFKDRHVEFSGTVHRWNGQVQDTVEPPDPRTDQGDPAGVIGAIKRGLLRSGLAAPEHVSDTSPIWQAVVAKYDSQELMGHPDDLMGTGADGMGMSVVHRIPLPHGAAGVKWATIVVTGEMAKPLEHLRTRPGVAGTFGGQQLREGSVEKYMRSGWWGSLAGNFNVDVSKDWYLRLAGGYARTTDHARSYGPGYVARDIVRTTFGAAKSARADGFQGEEFTGNLRLHVQIYAGAGGGAPNRLVADYRSGPGADDGARIRLVVPRALTQAGAAPEDAPRQNAEQIIDRGANDPRPHGGALESAMADGMKALHLPDLGALKEHLLTNWYGPTSTRGYHMLNALGRRNVRDNANALFRGELALSTPSLGLKAKPAVTAKATYRTVLRPRGEPKEISGLHFQERTQQPVSSIADSDIRNSHMSVGAGSSYHKVTPAEYDRTSTIGDSTRAAGGDYTELNRAIKNGQMSIEYHAKVTYTITDGERVRHFDSTNNAIQDVLVSQAADFAERYPSRFVHPDAIALPDVAGLRMADGPEMTRVARQFADDNADRINSATGDRLYVFGDITRPSDRAVYEHFANELRNLMPGGPAARTIDLGLITTEMADAHAYEVLTHYERQPGVEWDAPPDRNGKFQVPAPDQVEAMRRSWSATEPGPFLPTGAFLSNDPADVLSARLLQDYPEATTIAFGRGMRQPDGGYAISGLRFTAADLATAIRGRIGDDPPRWLVLYGTGTEGLARELSQQFAGLGKTVEVIGTDASRDRQLKNGPFRVTGPRWIAYHNGARRYQSRGLDDAMTWLRKNSHTVPQVRRGMDRSQPRRRGIIYNGAGASG